MMNGGLIRTSFEKQEDGTLKFLPIDGSYQITANGKRQYFSVIALKDGEAAKLQDDGTGAIWAIGNGIGKPSVSLYEVGWTPENEFVYAATCGKEVSAYVYCRCDYENK